MIWVMFVISVATLLVLVVVSLAALLKLPADARLPMQWGLSGKPTWFASRSAALGLTPSLACLVFAAMLAPSFFSGDAVLEPSLSASLTLAAGVFVLVHIAHIWLAVRHVDRHSLRRD